MSKETPYVDGWPQMPLITVMAKALATHTQEPIIGCVVVNMNTHALVATASHLYTLQSGFRVAVQQYDYTSITGVEVRTHGGQGDLVLSLPGYTGAHGIHFSSKNSIPDVSAMAEKIRGRLGSSASPATPDAADQLRKLGELRDAGVLTDDEFAAKKAELLARL